MGRILAIRIPRCGCTRHLPRRIDQLHSDRNRQQLFDEMRSLLETDYERIGWGASSPSEFRDAAVRDTFLAALTNFIQGPGAPATGDELTFLIGREVLQRIAPTILMMNFSDVEVAHAGSY